MGFRQGGYGGNRGSFNRGGGGGFRRPFNSGPREWTDITCAQCGKQDKVPFKPREGSEVLCKECYMKKKGITPREPREQPREEQQEEAQEYVDVPSEETKEESCECEECGSGEEEKAEDSEEF